MFYLPINYRREEQWQPKLFVAISIKSVQTQGIFLRQYLQTILASSSNMALSEFRLVLCTTLCTTHTYNAQQSNRGNQKIQQSKWDNGAFRNQLMWFIPWFLRETVGFLRFGHYHWTALSSDQWSLSYEVKKFDVCQSKGLEVTFTKDQIVHDQTLVREILYHTK